jgi:uncharacterized protein
MSVKSVWINLPVKNVKRSRDFFKAIGFRENPMHENDEHSASFFIGENDFILMLFPVDAFEGFARHEIADTIAGTEVLLSFDAQSKEEVDRMAESVRRAGGEIFAAPGESQGWMYAFGFKDPDGHRWNMLYMDISKSPVNIK